MTTTSGCRPPARHSFEGIAGLTFLALGVLLLVLDSSASRSVHQSQIAFAARAEASSNTKLCGEVTHKGWSKTLESWDAGGSDYYVLEIDHDHDVDNADIHGALHGNSIILRASSGSLSVKDFSQWNGKHVCFRGAFVTAKPYTPSSPHEQYPIGMDGTALPRGSGFIPLQALD